MFFTFLILKDISEIKTAYQVFFNMATIFTLNSDRPEQTVDPDQGLHCLSLIQLFLDTYLGSHTELFKF